MLKYILIAILLLSSPVFAISPPLLHQVVESDSSCCNTLSFASSEETFECENADDACCSDVVVSDDDSIIDTYSTVQSPPAGYGLGTHVAEISISGANQHDSYIYHDSGSADGSCTYGFWYYATDVNDYQAVYIASLGDNSSAPPSLGVSIRHEHFGTGSVRFIVEGDGDSDTSTVESSNAWFFIEFEYESGTTTYVNIYNSSMSLEDTISATAYSKNVRYLFFTCLYTTSVINHDLIYVGSEWSATGGGF